MKLGHVFVGIAFGCLLAEPCWSQTARTVYSVQGNKLGFDADGVAYAFQQAGLAPGGDAYNRRDRQGNLLSDDGRTIVARPVKENGRVVGYQSRIRGRSNTFVYLHNLGSAQGAYDLIASTSRRLGILDFNAHGFYRERDGRPGAGPNEQRGSAITLDNNRLYSGFGDGTGAAFRVNPLRGDARAQITARLYSCWALRDADGEGDDFQSVAASMDGVAGIRSAAGSAEVVNYFITPVWQAANAQGATRDQIQAAIDARRNSRKNIRTFDNLGSWLGSLAYDRRQDTLERVFGSVTVNNRRVNLSWAVGIRRNVDLTRLNFDDGLDTDPNQSNLRFDFPAELLSSQGGVIHHSIETELFGNAWISNIADGDSDPEHEVFQMIRHGKYAPGPVDPASAAGEPYDPISGVYTLNAVDGLAEQVGGVLEVSYLEALTTEIAGIYVLAGDEWVPLATEVFQAEGVVRAAFDVVNLGVDENALMFGAFGRAVPGPASFGVLGALLLPSIRRRRRAATTRSCSGVDCRF